ncbi:MAG: endonuclease/exonuclease/phosphatase family protein [Phycisphaeraceae bacterium]
MILLNLLLVGCVHPAETSCCQSGHASRSTLRVLTYNIHHGEGLDGRLDLQRIAEVINRVQPDLVALQEVDRGTRRSGRADEPAILADLTGMRVVFEKNINYDGGDYGNAVLSRWPITDHVNHPLPSYYDGEQRGLLEVHIQWHDRPITFFATHFDHRPNDTERLAYVELLRQQILKQSSSFIIVAGDLNATPNSRVMENLRGFLVDTYDPSGDPGRTFPADQPDRRIDYILHVPNANLRCIESRVLDEPVASDHRPYFAVLEYLAE